MDREEALKLLTGSEEGVKEWNRRRADGKYLSDLSDADLSRAKLHKANFHKVNLSGANLSKARLDGTNLSQADLTGATITKAHLSQADLAAIDEGPDCPSCDAEHVAGLAVSQQRFHNRGLVTHGQPPFDHRVEHPSRSVRDESARRPDRQSNAHNRQSPVP